jgi:hypothetical protein
MGSAAVKALAMQPGTCRTPMVSSGCVDSEVAAGLAVVSGEVVALGLAAGSVVSVFCSHAARRAALARMQIYFFIKGVGKRILL